LFVAYMAGLPDAVRTVGRAVGASFAAPAVTVGVASIIQLAAGDALLPRFVVFASLAVMPVVNLLVSLPLVASRGRGAVVAIVLASPRPARRPRTGHRARSCPTCCVSAPR
jgi:hypothetical protein